MKNEKELLNMIGEGEILEFTTKNIDYEQLKDVPSVIANIFMPNQEFFNEYFKFNLSDKIFYVI